MTTLTHTHTPNKVALSFFNDMQFTFCESCESNIERFWLEFDSDRLSMWSEWKVSQ